jgi:predicted CXXCH cytochrome family protein
MRQIGAVILAIAIGAGAVWTTVRAQTQPAPTRPTTRTTDCTASGCHAQQKNHSVLHGPNAVGACDACHEHVDPAQHTFQLKRQGRDLCEFCHIDKTGREGTVVHKPFATGDCTGCHDPHGATNRKLLKKDTTTELCTACHTDVLKGSHKHGPAASDCAICHKAHTADHEHLLTMDKKALCTSCHEDVGKQAASSKHPHPPVKSGACTECHQPHASDQPKILSKPAEELCATCHQKTVDSAKHAKFTHGALQQGKACLNCHAPHGSEFDKQMVADPIAACLKCHDKQIVVGKDHVVKGVPEIGDPKLHKHGAIEKGDCSGCHNVHGGEQSRLLVANYSNTFYQPYSEKLYDLCFKCHSKELIRTDLAEPQTRFRDGNRNLHALHVVAPGGDPSRGRNCRSCHSIHASKYTQLINDKVPFGAWQLPINFSPTESGGSCSPGCHEVQRYDRVKPAGPPKAAEALPIPTDDNAKRSTN